MLLLRAILKGGRERQHSTSAIGYPDVSLLRALVSYLTCSLVHLDGFIFRSLLQFWIYIFEPSELSLKKIAGFFYDKETGGEWETAYMHHL